jgi:hypothetical protein
LLKWVAVGGLRVDRISVNAPHVVGEAWEYAVNARYGSEVERALVEGIDDTVNPLNVPRIGARAGAADAIKSPWTWGGVAITALIDAYDYSFGPHSDEGIVSPGFAAAVTVDGGINIVSAGVGGATAGVLGGPPGMVVGFVAGVTTSVVLNLVARDSAHEFVSNVFEAASNEVQQQIDGTEAAYVYHASTAERWLMHLMGVPGY